MSNLSFLDTWRYVLLSTKACNVALNTTEERTEWILTVVHTFRIMNVP